MLFDLRGRGRRRTIQAIYLGLAILIGGGLVGFGIGGGAGGGGLLNAVGQNGGTGNTGDVYASNVKAAQKKTVATPKDPAAWAALVHALFLVAGNGKNFDPASQNFTASGKVELQKVKAAWTRYLALKPKTPNSDRAKEIVTALGPAGLNQIGDAVRAQEIVIAQNSTSASEYVRLAVLSYLASQNRKGDLASAQAVTLAPKDKQAELKQQLATAKTTALAQAVATKSGATTPYQLPGG